MWRPSRDDILSDRELRRLARRDRRAAQRENSNARRTKWVSPVARDSASD